MVTFDLREAIVPFSLLQIIHHFKKMRPGETIQIICNDEELEATLIKLIPDSNFIIDQDKKKSGEQGVRLRLRKKHRSEM